MSRSLRAFFCLAVLREPRGSMHPLAATLGEFTIADGVVAGGLCVAPEGETERFLPRGAHAVAGVAAVADAVGIRGESLLAEELADVLFVNPLGRGGDDVVAVVQHHGVGRGVAEVVEGGDGGCLVDGAAGLFGGIRPDEFDFVFSCGFPDVAHVVLALLLASGNVGRAVDDPDNGGFGVLGLNGGDADGGCPHKVCPPIIMCHGTAQVLPALEGYAAGHDDFRAPAKGGGHQQSCCGYGAKQCHAQEDTPPAALCQA